MSTRELRNALKNYVMDSMFESVAAPNVDFGARTPPYLDLTFAGVNRIGNSHPDSDTLWKEETGQFNVVVVTDRGEGENQASDIADTVASLFPNGGTIAVDGWSLVVEGPPQIRAGYPTATDYRTPVIINYHALQL